MIEKIFLVSLALEIMPLNLLVEVVLLTESPIEELSLLIVGSYY